MNKGIVMEVSRRMAVVMTRDGHFVKLKVSPDVQIGQEIEVNLGAKNRVNAVRWMSAAAAAVLLLLVTFSIWTVDRVRTGGVVAAVAYVTIDINPSVEFGIDGESRVVEAAGINDEGWQLLQEMDVIGLDVEEATEELIVRARPYIDRYVEVGYGEIVIASTIVADLITFNQEELSEKVRAVVYRLVQPEGADQPSGQAGTTAPQGGQSGAADPQGDQSGAAPQGGAGEDVSSAHPGQRDDEPRPKPIKVAALSVPKEVREDAKEKGISAGKLAVGLIIADQTGHEVPISDIKNKSITQLAEENGWLESMLQQDQKSMRSNLEQLFQKSVKGKGNISFEKSASWSQEDDGKSGGKGNHGGRGGDGRDDDRGGKKDNSRSDETNGKNGNGKKDNGRSDENRGKKSSGKKDNGRSDETNGKKGSGKKENGRSDETNGKKGNGKKANGRSDETNGKKGNGKKDNGRV
jgi:hypothetical protein